MTKCVLDTSALLAYVSAERGAEIVSGVIGDALISSVNYAEAVSTLVPRTGSLDSARKILGIAELDVIDFDRALAEQAGSLVTQTRRLGLSLGDRACLALAARMNCAAFTADRAWMKLDIGVEIRLIR